MNSVMLSLSNDQLLGSCDILRQVILNQPKMTT
jgi:hypothetical protein